MFINFVAVYRCIFSKASGERLVDLGAVFAVFVAMTASFESLGYWVATSSALVFAEFIFPPVLLPGGVCIAAADIAIEKKFLWRHIGVLLISLFSAADKSTRSFWKTLLLERA